MTLTASLMRVALYDKQIMEIVPLLTNKDSYSIKKYERLIPLPFEKKRNSKFNELVDFVSVPTL